MKMSKKEIRERENKLFIKKACQSLTQIGVESTPIKRDHSDYIRGRLMGFTLRGTDVIGNLAVNLKNLDAVQFYSKVETGGAGPSSSKVKYYCIDYLLRADMRPLRREIQRLDCPVILNFVSIPIMNNTPIASIG